MISHVYIGIADFQRALPLYASVMDELGLVQKFCDAAHPWAAWMQADQARPLFIIGAPYDGQAAPGNGQMIALLAPSRAAVQRAHAAALRHGGSCEGAPGLRPHYHPNYYGAYFRDTEGNKLCVCCHQAE